MPNIPNFWKTDLLPFIGKSFESTLNNKKKVSAIMNLFGEVTTKSSTYELRGMGDFPTLPKYTGELNKINPKRGFVTIARPEEVLGSYEIHYKQWLNDMSGEPKKAGKQLGEAAFTTIFMTLLNLFENAFNPAYKVGDGKAWAAADHYVASKGTKAGSREYDPDLDAGTYSNLITDELSTKAIDKARLLGAKYVTPSGNPYFGEYNLLLVSPENEAQARKLLGVTSQYRPAKDPDSAENAASSITDMKGYVVVGGGAAGLQGKQWAIADSSRLADTSLIVYNSKPEVSEGTTATKYSKLFVAYADYDIIVAEPKAIIFSNPA